MKKNTLLAWCGVGMAATLVWASIGHVSGMVVVLLVVVFLLLGWFSYCWGL